MTQSFIALYALCLSNFCEKKLLLVISDTKNTLLVTIMIRKAGKSVDVWTLRICIKRLANTGNRSTMFSTNFRCITHVQNIVHHESRGLFDNGASQLSDSDSPASSSTGVSIKML